MKKHLLCLLIPFLFLSPPSFAKDRLVKTEAIPGGIVIKRVPCNTRVFFNNYRVTVIKQNKKCLAIVGIPLSAKPGKKALIVESINRQKETPFYVRSKKYPAVYIKIKNRQMVTPNKKNLKRIKRKRKSLQTSFNSWRSWSKVNIHFIKPVKGRMSCPFGLKRFFNGKQRSSHAGVDIAAPTGTPVRAAASGVVINTENYYYTGNAVFINHGQGLTTVYCHLSKILVKPKQKVKQGQIIGRVGQTGRATGPHLHWGVNLNNARVNPMLFLKK
jgi:murein DD-endopeptidase MepM/ murein hydrolase activator NlpD